MKNLIRILSTIALTIIGLFIFLNLYNPQKEIDYKIEARDGIESPHFKQVLSTLMGPPFVDGNHVQALYNGDQIFPSMLSAIKGAKKNDHLRILYLLVR